MQRSTKAIIVLTVLVLVMGAGLAVAFINYGNYKATADAEKAKLQADLTKQKTLNDNLVRSQADMVSKADLDKWIAEHMSGIKEDLKGLDADLVAVSRATGRLGRSTSRPSRSDSVKLVEGSPELSKTIAWASQDATGELPWAWASVRPLGNDTGVIHARLSGILGPEKATLAMNGLITYMQEPQNAVWTTGTEPVVFEVTAATAETDEGLQTQYVQLWASNPDTGKKVPLAVMDASFMYADPEAPSFRLWSPHIDAGIVGVVTPLRATGGGTLGFSVASYGVTEDDNIWRFGRVGVGTDGETGWLEADPAGYNLGKVLPVVDDVWLYGGVVLSPDGYGASIKVTSTW